MEKLTEIKITFSQGSFAEWSEADGESYPLAFIEEWAENYHNILKAHLVEAFPEASVEVGEGYDQTMDTQIEFSPYNYETCDQWEREIGTVLYIGNDGEALDAIWTEPSLDAIEAAIRNGLQERPIYRLGYADSGFVFIEKAGVIWWLDLGMEGVLDEEAIWHTGTLLEAAKAFSEDIQ